MYRTWGRWQCSVLCSRSRSGDCEDYCEILVCVYPVWSVPGNGLWLRCFSCCSSWETHPWWLMEAMRMIILPITTRKILQNIGVLGNSAGNTPANVGVDDVYRDSNVLWPVRITSGWSGIWEERTNWPGSYASRELVPMANEYCAAFTTFRSSGVCRFSFSRISWDTQCAFLWTAKHEHGAAFLWALYTIYSIDELRILVININEVLTIFG